LAEEIEEIHCEATLQGSVDEDWSKRTKENIVRKLRREFDWKCKMVKWVLPLSGPKASRGKKWICCLQVIGRYKL
jgi:hypothetical protein